MATAARKTAAPRRTAQPAPRRVAGTTEGAGSGSPADQAAANPVAAQIAMAAGTATPAQQQAALAQENAETVWVESPRAFRLTDDAHVVHDVPEGRSRLRADLVDHFYAKANGLTASKK